MLVSDDSHVWEFKDSMLHYKPTRKPKQDVRTLPTFTIREAAVSLAINRWTLQDWYAGPEPFLKASGTYQNNGTIKLLSFRDLEEAYKLHLLRTRHHYSMQYIQKALVDARKKSKSDHPLIDHEMVVFDYLALDMPPKGKKSRQMIPLGTSTQMTLYIPDVLDTWGERIIKGEQIFPWKQSATDKVSRPVSMNASVHSGRLVITGTRIPVDILAGYSSSGRTLAEIAELYKLDVETVRKALQHIEPELRKVS